MHQGGVMKALIKIRCIRPTGVGQSGPRGPGCAGEALRAPVVLLLECDKAANPVNPETAAQTLVLLLSDQKKRWRGPAFMAARPTPPARHC